jgi:hypothetical protein
MKFATCFLLVTLIFSVGANAQTMPGVARGGSNFNWYTVVNCNREPYGVLVNYNTQTAAIKAQLYKIWQNGQTKLRIMIFHGHGISTGTVMDSTGGTLAPQYLTNIRNFLAILPTYNIHEIEVAFGPQGSNDPNTWSSLNQTLADENYGVILAVRSIVAASGLTYRLDLGNEMMTSSQTNGRYKYMKYIWPKYYTAYGSAYDSVGFSFASGEVAAISNMGAIYGHQSYPPLADIHIYPYGGNTAGDILYAFAHNLGTLGFVPGSYRYIIGEANFNNMTDALSMYNQIIAFGSSDSKPFYLMQWPINPAQPTCTIGDVSPFNNYEFVGF